MMTNQVQGSWRHALAALAAVLLAMWGPGLTSAEAPGKTAGEARRAPGFRLKRFADGKETGLAEFAGKIVVLDFFAHWCVSCARSAPVLEQEIQRYYEKRGGNARGVPVQVISINVEPGDRRATAAFVKKAGASLVLNDRDGSTLAAYGGTSLPFLAILDGTGATATRPEFTWVHGSDGFEGAGRLREIIDRLGPDASTARK